MPTLDVAINALRAKHGARQFDDAAKKIRRGARNVDSAVKKTDKSFLKFSKGTKNIALGLIGMAAAYKALRFSIASVKEFAAFEMGLANVSTMLDDTSMKYMPQYERQLKKMAREFGQTTGVLSKGLYDILSASVKADKAIRVLKVSSKAAIAGLTDTGTAADALTTILNSYGLAAEEATAVGDILFATVKAGKITFGELAGSIGKVSALAAAVGLDFTQVSAAISTMTRNGVQADIAMTALRAILVTFLKPQGDAVRVAAKFGLALDANTLRTIGLTGALHKLEEASEEEIATIFANQRALVGIAPLRNNLTALISDQSKALNSLGMQEEAYQKIADTTSQKLKMLAEDWKAIKVASGKYLADVFSHVKDIKGALDDLDEALERKTGVKKSKIAYLGLIGILIETSRQMDGLKKKSSNVIDIGDIGDWENKTKTQVKRVIEILEEAGQHVPGPMRQMLETTKDMVAANRALATARATLIDPMAELEKQIVVEKALVEVKKEAADIAAKAVVDEARAYRRLYDDLSQMGKTNFDYRLMLLDKEKEEYAEFIKDKALLDEWYAGRKAEIDGQMAVASDDFFAGFDASIEQMKMDLTTWGEVGAATAETLRAATSEAIISMATDWSSWDSALKGIGVSVGQTIQKMIADMIAMKLISAAIGGIGGMFGGGAAAGQMTAMEDPYYYGEKGFIKGLNSIERFAKGDILNGPTIFPMSNGGVGLGGEAGKEALMPLGRDSQGRLGVRTEGGGESEKSIKIFNIMDFSQISEYLNTGDGERQVVNIMERNASEIGISG